LIRVKAHAKVNLFLEITGKQADGYHRLSTVFQAISLADELTLSLSPDVRTSCSDPSLPVDERNLVHRAALQLQALLRERRGARIHLRKLIPLGAGLGGGSSDAAAVLRALPRLWKRRVPPSQLQSLAKRLGADVPFFLEGGLCAATGIGDRLRPLPSLPKTWLIIVYPGFVSSTKEAYARVKLPFANDQPLQPVIRALRSRRSLEWTSVLFNRLEDFVFPTHPAVEKLKEDLLIAGARATLMSGSGSTVFGVAASQADGRSLLAALKPKYPQSWLVHTL
jgi:4-diphosphocytidyl-2-C-methyl-D-erythritol kinase